MTDACTFNSAYKKYMGGGEKRNLCIFAYLMWSLFLHLLHLTAAFSIYCTAESANKLLLMFPYTLWKMRKPLFRLTDKLRVTLLHLEEGVLRAACLSGLPAWVVHWQWSRGGHVELKVKTLPRFRTLGYDFTGPLLWMMSQPRPLWS